MKAQIRIKSVGKTPEKKHVYNVKNIIDYIRIYFKAKKMKADAIFFFR